MFKKLITWGFFTILAGLLPIGFKWTVFGMTGLVFTYSSVCSEVFFFNIILSADGLKTLYDIDMDNKKNVKILLYATLIFVLIIISAIYGILLLNDYTELNLTLDSIYFYSKILTICCVVTNLSIQILGGGDTNEQ